MNRSLLISPKPFGEVIRAASRASAVVFFLGAVAGLVLSLAQPHHWAAVAFSLSMAEVICMALQDRLDRLIKEREPQSP